MKTGKKIITMMLSLVLVLGILPVLPVQAASAAVTIKAVGEGILGFQYSEKKDLTIEVLNNGTETLTNVQITPQTSESLDAWPFEIENKDYSQTIPELESGKSQQLTFTFTTREDVKTQYYKLGFAVSAASESGTVDGAYGIYVKTTAKPEEPKDDGKGDKPQGDNDGSKTEEPQTQPQNYSGMDAGGISNSDVISTGGGGSSSGTVPRVIVTGFTTDPANVKAGSNFKLTIHLKNTSTKTAVQNMLFSLSAPTEGTDANTSAPAFLPVSGSSSVYLDGIKAGETQDISIDLNAKADLVQKPYSIELAMKYEDMQPTQYESSSSLSIPVKQDARFEFGEFEISPESIGVGDEANVSSELRNLGRVKLYNVKAKFEGKSIESEEVFVGNVEPGATANIDGMVTGKKAGDGPETMKMSVSYEDEAGSVSTVEKEFQLEVTEAAMDMSAGMMPVEEEKSGFPIIPAILIVVAVLGIFIGIIIYRNKKKKSMEEEEDGLVDEFDRLTEDEHRES